MEPIDLPNKLLSTTILVVDDEPEHIQWLLDFIQAKGMQTQVVCSVADAIAAAAENQYRGYVVDLNIPMGSWTPTFQIQNDLYEKYKGFYVLKYVRTQGNLGKNVTAYSAHYNEAIIKEIGVLYCEYTSKERARDFKAIIEIFINKELEAHGIIKSTQTR